APAGPAPAGAPPAYVAVHHAGAVAIRVAVGLSPGPSGWGMAARSTDVNPTRRPTSTWLRTPRPY
ncbi:MAG: hypothetical protein M0Z42_18510, partial [Actinomycetota bacterium]|nr:hypothetical protein [Actinomycetota bacterium]